MRISGFLISILLVGMTVTVLGIMYADGATRYSQTYDASNFSSINKFETVNNVSQEIKEKLDTVGPTTGLTDIAAFISAGYSTLKLTFVSFDAFWSASNTGLGQIPYITPIVIFILTIALVAFIFIILSTLLNRDV